MWIEIDCILLLPLWKSSFCWRQRFMSKVWSGFRLQRFQVLHGMWIEHGSRKVQNWTIEA